MVGAGHNSHPLALDFAALAAIFLILTTIAARLYPSLAH
jgi:hypothetical protein